MSLQSAQATDLSGFATALKPKQKKIKAKVHHKSFNRRKSNPNAIRLNAQTAIIPEPPISSAVLWHAPPAHTIVRDLTPFELRSIDEMAMQIFLEAIINNYPQLEKATKISKMDILKAIGKELTGIDFDAAMIPVQMGQGKLRKRDAQNLLQRMLAYTANHYQKYKRIYRQNLYRNDKVIANSNHSKAKIIAICGNQAMMEVEQLWSQV